MCLTDEECTELASLVENDDRREVIQMMSPRHVMVAVGEEKVYKIVYDNEEIITLFHLQSMTKSLFTMDGCNSVWICKYDYHPFGPLHVDEAKDCLQNLVS